MLPEQIIDRIAKTTYVVLLRDNAGKLTLLVSPGLNKPWSSQNKKIADFHAAQCDGEARTWEEAFSLLRKEYPNFEKDLVNRVATAAKEQTTRLLPRPINPRPFLDQNGNPII